MKKISYLLGIALFIVGGFFVVNTAHAAVGDVIISEFFSDGSSDWVEIQNTTASAIPLSNFRLSDLSNPDTTPTEGSLLTLSGTLPAHGILVFNVSGLNDPGDSIALYNGTIDQANLYQRVTYGNAALPYVADLTAPINNQTGSFNGTSWSISSTPTKGWFNGAPSISSIVASINSAGITTNWGTADISDSSAAAGLYFEKPGMGRITFNDTLNLTDQNTVTLIQALSSKLEMQTAGTIGLNPDACDPMADPCVVPAPSVFKNVNATVQFFGVNALGYVSVPNIIVRDDSGTEIPVDNPEYPTITNLSYNSDNGGTISLDTNHFTQFSLDSSVFVDDDPGCGGNSPCYATIQAGIDAVPAGGTVHVAAGSYTEQITINKSLDLIGEGETTTTILAPDVRAGAVTQGATVHDYILAAVASSGTIDVRVEGFTIDVNSKNKTAGTARLDGVFFRDIKDAGGSVAGLFASTIHNFAAAPDYEAWGVAVYGDSLLTINDNDISDYTRDGLLVIGGNTTISNNTITGSATPLNGINIQDVTTGSVTGNTVTNNIRSAPWAGGGILVSASSGMTISSNHVNGNFYGINIQIGSNGITVSGNELTDNIKRGITLDNSDNNTVKSNTISGLTIETFDTAIGLNNTSTGNTIGGDTSGDGNTITIATSGFGILYAIYMESNVDTGINTIKYNTITGGQRAVQFDGPPGITGTTTIANNTISGQAWGGIIAYNNGDLTITDNTLTNTVRPMEFYGPVNLTITNNIVDGSTFDGINLGNVSGTISVSNNHIYNVTAENTYAIHARADVDNIVIDNNEIYDSFIGVWVDTGSTGNQITNNNIHDNTWGAISIHEDVSTITGNTLTNNQRGIETDHSITIQENSIVADVITDYCQLCLYADATYHASRNWWGTAVKTAITDWIVTNGYTVDYAPYYVTEEKTTLSDIKTITAFSIPSQTGSTTINQTDHTISLTMPYGTDVTALVPTFTTTGASVKIADDLQESGMTANDFSTSKTYTVYAIDETSLEYTATVNVALNPAKAITAFTIPTQVGNTTINQSAHTINLTLPYGTDVTTLVPTITITGASISPLSGAINNFSTQNTYTVTAADSSTQPYVVTLTILENTQTAPVTAEDGSGSATINSDTPEVVITNPDQAVIIIVGSGTTNPTIDVSEFISLVSGEKTGTLPEITIDSNVADVVIPDNTVVTGPASWDGVIAAPTQGTPTGGNPPAGFSVGDTVISVGSSEGTLTFNTAVTLVLPGVTGTVGYRPSGSNAWQTIENVCSGSYSAPGNPPAGSECAISNGIDTKIVTYHFTSFAGLKIAPSGGGHIALVATPTPATPVGQVLGASTGPIDGCGNRTTGFSITTGQSCIGNSGTAEKVLGAEKFNFSLFLKWGPPFNVKVKGPEVMELQTFLNTAGYGPLVVDGKFGGRTKAAVVKFQLANGLKGDGIIGPLTRAILNK